MVDSYRIQHAYYVDSKTQNLRRRGTSCATSPAFSRRLTRHPDAKLGHALLIRRHGFTRRTYRAHSAEDFDDRYYSIQLIDAYTFNFDYIGSRTTGNDAGSFLIAGPGWKGDTPPGIKKVIRSETDFALAGYRTQLFNPPTSTT